MGPSDLRVEHLGLCRRGWVSANLTRGAPRGARWWVDWGEPVARFGMDLGTANTVVCDGEAGFLFSEPSVLLRHGMPTRRPRVTVGHDAAELVGREPPGAVTVRPVRGGVVTDLDTARVYVRAVLRRALQRPWQRTRAFAVIAVPVGATLLEQRAMLEAAEDAGLARAAAIDAPVAGAIGCGVDPMERRVHLAVDLGAGTAEAAAFCFGGVLAARSTRAAGDEMTHAVHRHLREQHRLVLGEQAVEQLTVRAGTLAASDTLAVQGRDAGVGRARSVTVPAGEIQAVLAPIIESLVRVLSGCLDELPPQALDDLSDDGILLFGGTSLARGVDHAVEKAFGLPVKRAENPLTCVGEGAARAAGDPDLLAAYARG